MGLTQGEGEVIPVSPDGAPESTTQCTGAQVGVDNDLDGIADDGCIVTTDKCGDSIDNDGDTTADEKCDLVRAKNPRAGTGLPGGSHLAYGYSTSYRDADGDTIANNDDECPTLVDNGVDADGDGIDSVCDPNDAVTNNDEDGDNFQNQQDNCPLIDDSSMTVRVSAAPTPPTTTTTATSTTAARR